MSYRLELRLRLIIWLINRDFKGIQHDQNGVRHLAWILKQFQASLDSLSQVHTRIRESDGERIEKKNSRERRRERK